MVAAVGGSVHLASLARALQCQVVLSLPLRTTPQLPRHLAPRRPSSSSLWSCLVGGVMLRSDICPRVRWAISTVRAALARHRVTACGRIVPIVPCGSTLSRMTERVDSEERPRGDCEELKQRPLLSSLARVHLSISSVHNSYHRTPMIEPHRVRMSTG